MCVYRFPSHEKQTEPTVRCFELVKGVQEGCLYVLVLLLSSYFDYTDSKKHIFMRFLLRASIENVLLHIIQMFRLYYVL